LESCLLEGETFHDIAAFMAQHAAIISAQADIEARHASCMTTTQRERYVCLLRHLSDDIPVAVSVLMP
jgi:hypothetical protein